MNDAEFREQILSWMERTDDWMERTEEWKNKTDDQFRDIRASLSELQIGLGWIRGKLEGRQESDAALWGKVAFLAAVGSTGSVIIALLAYFK